MLLPIESLRRDGGTQPRATINLDTAYEYGAEMKAGAKFPAVVAFYDGSEYWLADGFHRVEGAFSVEIEQIECDVRQGTVEDARWFSFGVNQGHGLRRQKDDVRRAIEAGLGHPNYKSDNQLAKHIGCSQTWVSEVHRLLGPHLSGGAKMPKSKTVTRNGVTYQQNTGNIGKRPAQNYDGGTRVEMKAAPIPPTPTPTPKRSAAPEPSGSAEQDTEVINSSVGQILDSESTPSEIAAYIVAQHIDISTWEDARDFLSAVIEKAKRS
jgi:hypothetical protein